MGAVSLGPNVCMPGRCAQPLIPAFVLVSILVQVLRALEARRTWVNSGSVFVN